MTSLSLAMTLVFLLFFSSLCFPMSIDTRLRGPQSLHTRTVIQLYKTWPQGRKFCNVEETPLRLMVYGLRTKDRPYYVGSKKCIIVQAPLETTVHVVDDYEHFAELFPGLESVKLVDEVGNLKTLTWRRIIPFFLASNFEYQMDSILDKNRPDRYFIRYQFRKGERLKSNDGLTVLERRADGSTLFTNYEFYEADYGIGLFGIQAVSSDRAWDEGIHGTTQAILLMRFKSEHPDWSYSKVRTEADKTLEKIPKRIDYDEIPLPH